MQKWPASLKRRYNDAEIAAAQDLRRIMRRYQSLIIDDQSLIIDVRPLIIGVRSLEIGDRPLVIGDRSLVKGDRPLIMGLLLSIDDDQRPDKDLRILKDP